MRGVPELLGDLHAQSAREVVIWKARAVGVSADLEAARTMAENIARAPWRATCGPKTMQITRDEYDLLAAAGARPYGPRVVAGWIYAVLSPQIVHCEDEYELLASTLTFRPHRRQFERLKPLRRALLPEG